MELEEKIRRLLAHPTLAREVDWAQDPEVVAGVLQHALDASNSDPEAGRRIVSVAWRVAARPCDRVQVHGLFARCLRAQGLYQEGLDRLQIAFDLGDDCPACLADLLRRRAFFLRDQKQFSDALHDVNESIRLYQRLGSPGHDLYGNGLASAYLCRGQVHLEDAQSMRFSSLERRQAFASAIEDMSTALSLTHPTVSKELYAIVAHNLASTLVSRGRDEDLVRAAHSLPAILKHFSGTAKISQERCKADWLTSMIRYELYSRKLTDGIPGMAAFRPSRARDRMLSARRGLISLNLVQEAAAITADVGRMVYPDRLRLRETVRAFGKALAETGTVVPVELRAPLVRLEQAVRQPMEAPVIDEIRKAIEGLREACGPRMLSCLISWKGD